jgi:UDP-N-acetylglucosamine 2-epimerase (non-hydrolysing)
MQSFLSYSVERVTRKKKARFLLIFGTRPEAIKLAPLAKTLKEIGEVVVCVTGQHREMLDQVLDFFSIRPNYDLNIMKKNQSLFGVTATSLLLMEKVIDDACPDVIIVQGDTTTAFIGALAGFYKQVKVAHIEAGLRSFNKYSPFPEEINRSLVGRLADYHFAPTEKARKNLLDENVNGKNIFVVGNTVIDALFLGMDIINKYESRYLNRFHYLDPSKKLILVTGHRRESFGRPFGQICRALKEIAKEDVEIVYPVHLNPNVTGSVYPMLGGVGNIHLTEPVDYPSLIWLMSRSYLVLTDSGGIQEEAPSLGKPVLVMRNVTERTEGIEAGTAVLVGTDRAKIVESTRKLLHNRRAYEKMSKRRNPYGDGTAASQIRDVLIKIVNGSPRGR